MACKASSLGPADGARGRRLEQGQRREVPAVLRQRQALLPRRRRGVRRRPLGRDATGGGLVRRRDQSRRNGWVAPVPRGRVCGMPAERQPDRGGRSVSHGHRHGATPAGARAPRSAPVPAAPPLAGCQPQRQRATRRHRERSPRAQIIRCARPARARSRPAVERRSLPDGRPIAPPGPADRGPGEAARRRHPASAAAEHRHSRQQARPAARPRCPTRDARRSATPRPAAPAPAAPRRRQNPVAADRHTIAPPGRRGCRCDARWPCSATGRRIVGRQARPAGSVPAAPGPGRPAGRRAA